MKRLLLAVLGLLLLNTFFVSPTANAVSIRLQPLQYTDTLGKAEKKKGFVDITNPSDETIKVTTTVQAFRQVNDEGKLFFYDDAQVAAGVIPDLKSFELGAKDTMRLFFLIDGTKLPSGDVFAALFATATPTKATGPITQPVRVGTLFSLVNGTPGPRKASIVDVETGFWQFGPKVAGTYDIRNTADASQNTGFYPTVRVSLTPLGADAKVASSLVFAGRTRTNTFSLPSGNRFGVYQLSVSHESSTQNRWVFVASGWGKLIPVGFIAIVLAAWLWWRRRRTLAFSTYSKRR